MKLWGLIAILVLVAGFFMWWIGRGAPNDPERPSQITRTAEGTNIPSTAKQLDDFAFVDPTGVYLRAAVGTSTVKIPDADPETFKAVSPLKEYSTQEIVDFCKAPGRYAFYADKKKVYMFQVWLTETFTKTKLEVLKDVDPDTFTVTGSEAFRSGKKDLTLGYTFATTTCMYEVRGL